MSGEPSSSNPMNSHAIRLLSPEEAAPRLGQLAALLAEAVEGGASVNFVWPMTASKAEAWWQGALASHARGERLIFWAGSDEELHGSVQLVLAPQENQAFRADIAKLLVHRRARRQGLGRALMQAAEAEARRIGRTLLTLDTETGSPAEHLYAALGWTKYGEIPGYATCADRSRRAAASFFYKEL
ncbi:GNAT family N-acetyltransferase [Geminicoccus roseus]|uniref:GNAT family N-acetyltransferase n=1 Tax=Geminicoccus roseus TaxID=404900 RepID=UPI00196A1C5E|nr:GNAT family N-acetyltransferase [Geminicoccus roseus]